MANVKLNLQQKLLRAIKRDKRHAQRNVFAALLLSLASLGLLHGSGQPGLAEAGSKTVGSGKELFSALLVGDIYFGPAVEKAAAAHGYPYLLEPIASYLDQADFATGGLTPVEIPLRPSFSAASTVSAAGDMPAPLPLEKTAAEALKAFNFTALSLADPGGAAGPLDQVLSDLSRAGVDAVGAGADFDQARAISYSEINGVRVAVLGFSDASPRQGWAQPDQSGILPADPSLYLPLTREARRNAELVIVHIHWGSWDGGKPQPRQVDLSKALADAGADLVIGHLPHRIGPVEVYNGTLIFYSLGSLISDQAWASTSRLAAAARYSLFDDGTARVQIIPLWVQEGRPRPLTAESTLDRSRRNQIYRWLTEGANLLDQARIFNEGSYLVFEIDHNRVVEGGAEIAQ